MMKEVRIGVLALTIANAALAQDVIAGVAIPQTPLAQKAEAFVRAAEPDFLYNHSLRTYIWGAMWLKARGLTFDPETAYVAALFHDYGLTPEGASPRFSFEVDSANKAEAFVKENGGSPEQARTVWNAIVFHDLGGVYESHQSNEALLLGAGAGGDVDGLNPKAISADTIKEVLAAVPRLQFKQRFTALAIDHCKRKPTSQIGWLDGLCRSVSPNVDRGSVQDEIASAPFDE